MDEHGPQRPRLTLPAPLTEVETCAFRAGALFGLYVLERRAAGRERAATSRLHERVEARVHVETIHELEMARGFADAERLRVELYGTLSELPPDEVLASAREMCDIEEEPRPDHDPERLRIGLVLACQQIARLRMEIHRDESGEDFDDHGDAVRLGGAEEMGEIMMRADSGEAPA